MAHARGQCARCTEHRAVCIVVHIHRDCPFTDRFSARPFPSYSKPRVKSSSLRRPQRICVWPSWGITTYTDSLRHPAPSLIPSLDQQAYYQPLRRDTRTGSATCIPSTAVRRLTHIHRLPGAFHMFCPSRRYHYARSYRARRKGRPCRPYTKAGHRRAARGDVPMAHSS